MNKKMLLLYLLITSFAAFSFDLDITYGFDSAFLAQVEGIDDYSEGPKLNWTTKTNLLAFGAFIDIAYAEAGFGVARNLGESYGEQYKNDVLVNSYQSEGLEMTFLTLNFLAKFPIALNDTFTVYPGVGVRYVHLLSEYYGEVQREFAEEEQGLRNDLFVVFAAGVDYHITNDFYIRLKAHIDVNLSADVDRIVLTNPAYGYAGGVQLALGIMM